ATIALTLRSQKIRALGIMATDPMDEAYLIRSFKKSSPNVRLFLRDPDLIYFRISDVNVGALNGTLLVSDYPLIPRNPFWTGTPKDTSVDVPIFPSGTQEGQYNAFVQLLEEAKVAPSRLQRLELHWPAGKPSSGTPLWLAIMGTAGHLPVAMLNGMQSKPRPNIRTLKIGKLPIPTILIFVLISVIAAGHTLALRFPSLVSGRAKSYFNLHFTDNERSSYTKAYCHLLALLTLAIAELVAASSCIYFFHTVHRVLPQSSYSWLGLVGVAILLFVVIECYRLIRKLLPFVRNGRLYRRLQVISACGLVAVLLFGGMLWAITLFSTDYPYAFQHYRNLLPVSGVAPALPVLFMLAVIYSGIWVYLRMLVDWTPRYIGMKSLCLDGILPSDFSSKFAAIDKNLVG